MEITLLGIFFGLLLLAIPVSAIYYLRLPVLNRVVRVVCRTIVAVAVIALVVFGALSLDSIVYDIVMLLALSLLSAVLTLGKARLKVSKLIIPAAAGSIVAVAVVVFYVLFLVLAGSKPFVAHLFVPLAGIVAGGIVGANTKALQTYYSGLLHHGQLYNYIIGNGGTHAEAVHYFVRRSLQASIVSISRDMSRLVFVSAPTVMLAMVMSGASVLTAAAFQILVYVAVMAASVLSVVITLFVGRKYSFDEYERLKPVAKAAKATVAEVVTGKASDSSASPAIHLGTDSANQQQE